MNHSNPIEKKRKKVVEDAPLDKFKPLKPRLSRGSGKALVEVSCSPAELMWIERWLNNIVQSRSLPPQIGGADAFNAMTQFLAPQDVLALLEQLRGDFLRAHPQRMAPEETKDDFGFLLECVSD